MLPIRKQDLPFFKEFLMVMAGLVVLIACSNVANMMLAKAAEGVDIVGQSCAVTPRSEQYADGRSNHGLSG